MLVRVTCCFCIGVDEDFQVLELLGCSTLHLGSTPEEFHCDSLFNVGIPEHLSQEWLRQLLKLSDFITQVLMRVVDDVIFQMPSLSLSGQGKIGIPP